MNWKNWKLGLFVAALTGLCAAGAGGLIFPEATWKQLGIILAASIGKDIMLFLVQHPADAVTFDSHQSTVDASGAKTESRVTITQPPVDPAQHV